MKNKMINGFAGFGYGILIGVCGYIAGHAACAHERVDYDGQAKLVCPDGTGKISYQHYFKEAFKDLKRTLVG